MEDKCVVTVVNQSMRFWLRVTTWSAHLERADRYETATDAQNAITKASKFHKKSLMKRVEIWSGNEEFLKLEGEAT